MDPVTTRPLLASMNAHNSTNAYEVLPTSTFENVPDLDVLLVPGGLGSRNPNLNSTLDFIAERYPKVKYLISVCTGSLLLSRAGVLDDRRATTNKASWYSVTATNSKVDGVPHARWVVDGNIWTTSGVSAGIDGIFAFIQCQYGADVATRVANLMEYERHIDPDFDPFSEIFNVTKVYGTGSLQGHAGASIQPYSTAAEAPVDSSSYSVREWPCSHIDAVTPYRSSHNPYPFTGYRDLALSLSSPLRVIMFWLGAALGERYAPLLN